MSREQRRLKRAIRIPPYPSIPMNIICWNWFWLSGWSNNFGSFDKLFQNLALTIGSTHNSSPPRPFLSNITPFLSILDPKNSFGKIVMLVKVEVIIFFTPYCSTMNTIWRRQHSRLRLRKYFTDCGEQICQLFPPFIFVSITPVIMPSVVSNFYSICVK